MANSDLTALTPIGTPITTDILYIVDDPASTKLPRKVTVDQILAVNDARTKAETNTSIDANGTGNVLTNIGDAELETHVSTKITGLPTQTQAVDLGGFNIDNVQNLIHDLSTATTTLDFAGDELQEISIAANTTFAASSNIAIGRSKTVIITTDGTLRTLTFPGGWTFIGATPADQAATKIGVLTLTCRTGIESGVIASYGVQE